MKAKPKKVVPKIMLFGTFDGLHPGHLNLFKQARALVKGDSFLVVSVARDKNVLKIKNGLPTLNEKERRSMINKIGLADKVVLGGVKEYIPHILKEKPDIIALGYDQVAYVENLKKDLEKNGLSVKIKRLKPYKPHVFKNKLLKQLPR